MRNVSMHSLWHKLYCAAGIGLIRSEIIEIYEEMRDYSAFVE